MRTIAITIDEDTLTRLDHLVDQRSRGGRLRSRSRVIRDAVKEYVMSHERLAAEAREAAIIRRHGVQLMQQASAAVREQAEP